MIRKNGIDLVVYAGIGTLLCGVAWAQPAAKSETTAANVEVAAVVGGKPITLQELDAKVLKKNIKLAQSLYDARRAVLDQVIIEHALSADATAKGITVDQFIREKVAEKAKPINDADVEAFFKTNAAQMAGKTLEQVSGQIRARLSAQNDKEARDAFTAQVKEKAQVKITLEPPRVEMVIAANDPFKGGANAKVIIAEYSDFQ
ncbi:MAG: hypothetical protein AABZ47_06765 [Planctomycetota bacterium]